MAQSVALLAVAVGGAAGGAAGGATSAALNKRDPVTGALVGAAGGAVAGGISEGLADPNIGDAEAQEGGFYGEKGVDEPIINPELQRFIASSGGRLAGQFTARELSDTGGGGGGATYRPTADTGSTRQTIGEPTMGMGAPGSAALGQALRIGSGEPGAPIESPGGGETTTRPVWNIASLRVKDEGGGEA